MGRGRLLEESVPEKGDVEAGGLRAQGGQSQRKTREGASTGHYRHRGGKHVQSTKNHLKWLEPGGAWLAVLQEIVSFPKAPKSQDKELGFYSR